MYRDVLGWLGALLVVALLVPILLYLVTGAAVGFLVSCGGSGPAATMAVGASGADSLTLTCSAVRTMVKTTVAVGGTAATTLGVAIVAVGDLVRSSGVR